MTPNAITHPTLGPCELVPSLLAIRWAVPQVDRRATTAIGARAKPADVNESDSLSWVSGKRLTDAAMQRVRGAPNVEWVAPVYRASGDEPGTPSCFAINPTVLFVSPQARDGALEQAGSIDIPAWSDESRNRHLKWAVALRLPGGNAIELRQRLIETGTAAPEAIRFEEVPYLVPAARRAAPAATARSAARR